MIFFKVLITIEQYTEYYIFRGELYIETSCNCFSNYVYVYNNDISIKIHACLYACSASEYKFDGAQR